MTIGIRLVVSKQVTLMLNKQNGRTLFHKKERKGQIKKGKIRGASNHELGKAERHAVFSEVVTL